MEHGTIHRSPVNGQPEFGQDEIKQPNRPAECSGVLARITPNDSHVKVMPILTPDRLEKRQNGRRIKNEGEPSFTLTSQDRHGVLIADDHIKIRKLTPRECFRLQGFTDEQFDRAAAVNSETQLYKQAGNAVTVNVVEEIGRHIMEVQHECEGVS